MDIVQSIWPQRDPRMGDPDSFESGYGLHPAIVKLSLINVRYLEEPDPRSRIDLKIGWRRVRDALQGR